MGLALHPYIVGQPHRLRPLRQALRHILGRAPDRAWPTTADAIAASFAAQVSPTPPAPGAGAAGRD